MNCVQEVTVEIRIDSSSCHYNTSNCSNNLVSTVRLAYHHVASFTADTSERMCGARVSINNRSTLVSICWTLFTSNRTNLLGDRVVDKCLVRIILEWKSIPRDQQTRSVFLDGFRLPAGGPVDFWCTGNWTGRPLSPKWKMVGND